MRIIHLSDLHFGTEKQDLVDLVLYDLKHWQPHLIVVSGDLTQRARAQQFKRAKIFLQSMPVPVICVPGNHDIPLYNLVARLLYPFSNYQKLINASLCVSYQSNEMAIFGVNSVTPYKPMSGYVTEQQLDLLSKYFNMQRNHVLKIVIMHHNLIKSTRHQIINDAEKLIKIFGACGVNLVLCGHIHAAHIEKLKTPYTHDMYVITAGTAISTRTIEPNSYNVVNVEDKQLKVIVRSFINDKFVTTREVLFPLNYGE